MENSKLQLEKLKTELTMTDNNSLELIPSFGIEKFTDNCLKDVTHILSQAQTQGYRAVNTVMIQAYWLVGARIVLEEQHGVVVPDRCP